MSEELREPLLPEEVILDDSESDASDHEEGGVRAIILSRLKAVGRVTTDGLTSKYADTFSAPLERLMSEKEFRAAIGAINQTLADYFPCLCCVVYAYVGYVATCGLMSCCARPCTSEVEENVRRVLRRINRKHIFQSKGIHWRLKRSRCSSWIEISHCPQKDQRRVSITVPANRRMSIPIASGQRSPIRPSPHAPPDPGSDRRHSALS